MVVCLTTLSVGDLPGVVEAVFLCQVNLGLEEIAEGCLGQQIGFGTVADDATFAQQQNAIDLGNNVGDMMRDQQDAGSLLGQSTQQAAEFALCIQVECIRRLVEQKHLRRPDQSASDHDAPLLTGGHLANRLVDQVDRVDLFDHFIGALLHSWSDGEVGPEGAARKKSGKHSVTTRGVKRRFTRQFSGDDTQPLFKFGEVPTLTAKDADPGFRLDDWIALAGNRLDESGFSAAIGAKDSDMFTGIDAEIDVVENVVVAASYVDVGQFEKWWHLICRIDVFARVEE